MAVVISRGMKEAICENALPDATAVHNTLRLKMFGMGGLRDLRETIESGPLCITDLFHGLRGHP